MGEERSLFEVFWWGAIALWMGECDRCGMGEGDRFWLSRIVESDHCRMGKGDRAFTK